MTSRWETILEGILDYGDYIDETFKLKKENSEDFNNSLTEELVDQGVEPEVAQELVEEYFEEDIRGEEEDHSGDRQESKVKNLLRSVKDQLGSNVKYIAQDLAKVIIMDIGAFGIVHGNKFTKKGGEKVMEEAFERTRFVKKYIDKEEFFDFLKMRRNQ